MTDCGMTMDCEIERASETMIGVISCGVCGIAGERVRVTRFELQDTPGADAYALLRQKAKALCKRGQER